jgi:hypothetical protein
LSASGTCLSCFITPMLCARRIAVSHHGKHKHRRTEQLTLEEKGGQSEQNALKTDETETRYTRGTLTRDSWQGHCSYTYFKNTGVKCSLPHTQLDRESTQPAALSHKHDAMCEAS